MNIHEEAAAARKADHPIDPMILNRWSPRAMSGEAMEKGELMTLFEAARWAPSSYNNQSWKFVYAMRDTDHWQGFFDLMVEGNQGWAKNAAVLILVISKKVFDYNGKPSRSHSFDTGAAWQNIALQGAKNNFVVHAMEGFDYDKAAEMLSIPEDHQIEALVAIGHPGKKEDLPEAVQKAESPNDRKKVDEFISEGEFSF